MSYSVFIKDSEKAVIVLEVDEKDRAYVASQFASNVSEKSSWRFDEEADLVKAWFGLYRTGTGNFEVDYDFEDEFSSLKQAIKFCKEYNKDLLSPKDTCGWKCRANINMSVNILNSNEEDMTKNVNVLEKYEQDAFFTKENLAKASKINGDVKSAVAWLRRVIDLLYVTADKVEYIWELINSSANSYDVEGTKKALDRAQKVLDALQNDKVFKFALDTGKTKLETDLKEFNVEEFLGE